MPTPYAVVFCGRRREVNHVSAPPRTFRMVLHAVVVVLLLLRDEIGACVEVAGAVTTCVVCAGLVYLAIHGAFKAACGTPPSSVAETVWTVNPVRAAGTVRTVNPFFGRATDARVSRRGAS